ncbi:hypothetical protein FAGKG844_290071 [Frankia sp. AgKG'84/4]
MNCDPSKGYDDRVPWEYDGGFWDSLRSLKGI